MIALKKCILFSYTRGLILKLVKNYTTLYECVCLTTQKLLFTFTLKMKYVKDRP